MSFNGYISDLVDTWHRLAGRLPGPDDPVVVPSAHRMRFQLTVSYPNGVWLCGGCEYLTESGKEAAKHAVRYGL